MNDPAVATKPRFVGETAAIGFMTVVVWLAGFTGISYLLFPELAALTHEVLQRPNGKWASQPWKLVVTPTCTAVAGTLIGNWRPYGVFTVTLAVCAAIAVIRVLRSPVAPAISAGVLPIVFGVTSWRYPVCGLGTLCGLTLMLLAWKRMPISRLLLGAGPTSGTLPANQSVWVGSVLCFVVAIGFVAQATGLRFILFPPLIVMAYEMLGNPETCPWANKLVTFPLVSTVSAAVGIWAIRSLQSPTLAAAVVLVLVSITLRLTKLRLPPAFAIGLIPFVMRAPSELYPVSVAAGTCSLSVWFFSHQWLFSKRPSNGS